MIVVGGPQYRVGSHRQFALLARALARVGIPALRFDYRGMGDSEGDRRSFDEIDADIAAAIDTLCREAHLARVVLWGLCDGA
ncbi:MAG: alpha/beta fold hydrolase, partial [Casimicrobiaceae bacterium]